MGYYLMIKTIKENGVRYLCKCIDSKDHIAYKGSGVFWKKILNRHPNYTILTTVLGHYETKEELKEAGLYYSELYNVVRDKTWANCIPEIGDGGPTTLGRVYGHDPLTKKNKAFLNESEIPAGWIKGQLPKGPRDPAVTAKIISAQKGKKRSEEVKEKMRNAVRKPRYTIQCEHCDREITKQNIKKHMEKTHGIH